MTHMSRTKISITIDRLATVFQAEIAIEYSAKEIKSRAIYCYSQAAIKAVDSSNVTSK